MDRHGRSTLRLRPKWISSRGHPPTIGSSRPDDKRNSAGDSPGAKLFSSLGHVALSWAFTPLHAQVSGFLLGLPTPAVGSPEGYRAIGYMGLANQSLTSMCIGWYWQTQGGW
jgi:hypothetical protein